MSRTELAPKPFSLKRHRLCSRTHAERVAWQLCDDRGGPVGVIRTGDALQPYRVTMNPIGDDEALEIAVDC